MCSQSEPPKRHLKVVIIGGSLAGLMCGIALKHGGHAVEIFEQDDDQRHSHMAGIGLGPIGAVFLRRHDRFSGAFTHTTNGVKLLKEDGSIQSLAGGCRQITSWDTLYLRFRSIFDGYSSNSYPRRPEYSETDGVSAFHPQTKITELRSRGPPNSRLTVIALNTRTQEVSHVEADLVIGADGPDSVARAKYLPTVHRQYSGYVAWRGTVAQKEVSASTSEVFMSSVVAHTMQGQHCIIYSIPGANGSVEPGERLLNFLWYTNETQETLGEIMIDGIDGHRHHNIVPSGHVRDDIWLARVELARRIPLPTPFLEVVEKIERPFIQVIDDFCSPCASFEHGKLLLVGDALSLFRPHAAMGGAQAAYHAMAVEDYVDGRISLRDWENRVLRYSFSYWLQSVWWGDFYQRSFAAALISGVRYWVYCGFSRLSPWGR